MIDSMGGDHNPVIGIYGIPCAGVGNCNTPQMGIKDVLAENLKALMAQRPNLDTLPKITAKTDGRLSNGKLDRIRRAAVATGIDSLEELAEAFGIEPWRLLQKGGTAQQTEIASITPIAAARAKQWPFPSIDPEKVGALTPDEAADLERAWLRVAKALGIDVEVGVVKKQKRH